MLHTGANAGINGLCYAWNDAKDNCKTIYAL